MFKKLILLALLGSFSAQKLEASPLAKAAGGFAVGSLAQLGFIAVVDAVNRTTNADPGQSYMGKRSTFWLLCYSLVPLSFLGYQLNKACDLNWGLDDPEIKGAALSTAAFIYLYQMYGADFCRKTLGIVTFPFSLFE